MPGYNTATYKRLPCVLPCQCNYTSNAPKQRTGLYRGFSCDCTRSTAPDTRPTKAAIMSPAARWRAYTRMDTLHLYQIPPPRRDAVQVSTAAYYNKVYKRVQGCALLWIHARQCSTSQTMPAVAGQLLPCTDCWQVPTRCQQYRPGAPAEGVSVSACQSGNGQPGGVSMLPTSGGWRSGTGSAVSQGGAFILAPSTRRGSPAAGAGAHGAEPLAAPAASLFGLSPDS